MKISNVGIIKRNTAIRAIDFETANRERSSTYQIGIVVVENGIIVDEF